jgi:hypothetical protein
MTIPSCWLPYGGSSAGIYSETTLRQLYDKHFAKLLLPPEQQWQEHLAVLLPTMRGAGYSDAEIKWWLGRTGQGPKCFTQYTIGPGALPPYDVWAAWYFC